MDAALPVLLFIVVFIVTVVVLAIAYFFMLSTIVNNTETGAKNFIKSKSTLLNNSIALKPFTDNTCICETDAVPAGECNSVWFPPPSYNTVPDHVLPQIDQIPQSV